MRPEIGPVRLGFQVLGSVVLDLPLPEDVVDPAVVEEKDWIKRCCVVLAHVTVGTLDWVIVALIGDLEAADGEMDLVVGAFQRGNSLETKLVHVMVVPGLGGGGVRKDVVVGGPQALFILPPDAGINGIALVVVKRLEVEPVEDIVNKELVCGLIPEFPHLSVVCVRCCPVVQAYQS